MNNNMLTIWDRVFSHSPIDAFYENFSNTTFGFTEFDNTVNFRNHSGVRRLSGFKQFCYSWKTTSNITGFTNRTRNFYQCLSTDNFITFSYDQICIHRKNCSSCDNGTIFINNFYVRTEVSVFRLHNYHLFFSTFDGFNLIRFILNKVF